MLLRPNAGLTSYAQLGMAPKASRHSGGGYAKLAAGAGSGIASGSGGGFGGGAAMPPPPPINALNGAVTMSEVLPQAPDQQPTGERAVLESKLSPVLLQHFDCWKKQESNCKLPEDGTVEIQLFLTDDSPAVLEQIKALGFSLSQDRLKEKIVVGRIAVGKLAELANVQTVRFITVVRR